MNVNTGCIFELRPDEPVPADCVEVRRSLKAKEKADMQIKMYSPCGCGSGKKFRFCCYRKANNRI